MRRLEFLANQVRKSTDNTDTNGVSNQELQEYYNAAQSYIQTLIFKSNPDADFFKAYDVQNFSSTGEYTLPEDCFSINSIYSVELNYGNTNINQGYVRVKPIQESEKGYMFGYFIKDNTVTISGSPSQASYSSIRITYFRRLQTLGFRQAKVNTVNANTSLVLNATPEFLYNVDDHCSAVTAQGSQAVAGIYFTNTSGSTLVTGDTAGVTTSHYIVSGKNATNASELPDECEVFLQDYVRQRLYTRNNYDDANKQINFTQSQMEQLTSLFAKNKKDDDTIPITDVGYLTW